MKGADIFKTEANTSKINRLYMTPKANVLVQTRA